MKERKRELQKTIKGKRLLRKRPDIEAKQAAAKMAASIQTSTPEKSENPSNASLFILIPRALRVEYSSVFIEATIALFNYIASLTVEIGW